MVRFERRLKFLNQSYKKHRSKWDGSGRSKREGQNTQKQMRMSKSLLQIGGIGSEKSKAAIKNSLKPNIKRMHNSTSHSSRYAVLLESKTYSKILL